MDQTKSIKLQKKRLESAEERRARLDKANEKARAKRRMETDEQKNMRLGKRNARDRARLISQMPVDKKIRLEKRKVTLANESCELRDARLEHMRTLQQLRLQDKEMPG